MYNFSIILASRQRVPLLTQLLESIKNTTNDLSQVEVLIGIDYDDNETQKALGEFDRYIFASFYSRERSNMLNKDYLNWLAYKSSGRYLIIVNDDAIFRTMNWDEIILTKLNQYFEHKDDNIIYGYIDDALVQRYGLNYCCFPLLGRNVIRALGYVMPPQFTSWGADVYIWQVFNGVNKTIDLSNVLIEHRSHPLNRLGNCRTKDSIDEHVANIASYNWADVPKDTIKLKNYLANYLSSDQM